MTQFAYAWFYCHAPRYRKVGGIHWIACGRLRLAIMWRRSHD
jgi:hypothetical protein